MTYETITLKPKQLFHHKVEGYLIPSDLNQYIINFWQDEKNLASHVNTIWDLRETNFTSFSFEAVDHLANTILDDVGADYRPGLTSILINDSPEKHIAAYLTSLLSSIKDRKFKIFHSYDQALHYVKID